MKKFIFTLLLAIVSSVWMMSKAICMVAGTHIDGPTVSISGEIIQTAMPCGDEEPCANCLTPALSANEDIYYFSTTDPVVERQLDSIMSELVSVNCICVQPAVVTGVLYMRGGFHYIAISSITVLGDIQPKNEELRLNSLCNEWNVLVSSFCWPTYSTVKYYLSTDTIINGQRYKKLTSDSYSYLYYKGAMREGTNADIYFVPAGSTNEFLLYAFNAQVGEVLNNLYLGGIEENGYSGRVEAISDGSPRLFTIRVLYPTGMGVEPGESFSVTWIEGVGSPETPYGLAVVPSVPAYIGVYTLLCAYKNGEQVYKSEAGQRYGCEHNSIPIQSLCDEWNIAKISNAMGPYEEIHTVKAALSTDTIIGTQKYVKLFEAGLYKGALREGKNRDIYYIPNGSAHEYLLYNFNANVGDTLSNLWYGGSAEQCPNGYNATVLSISEETPRVFTVEVEYILSDSEGDHIDPLVVFWTEGVGLFDGPAGQICPGPDCACSCGQVVLCAYKNGEQVYTSDLGKKYGCEYNYDPYLTPDDTIPLYIKDNPGTSTVDPADPNLIYAVLRNDMLIIRDFTGVEIFLTLSRNGSLFGPRLARSVQAQQSFADSTSVELTEEGTYEIELTSESWNYIVVGSFDFNKTHEAVEIIPSERPAASKILRNGQLLIRIGDQLYTPSGVLVQ